MLCTFDLWAGSRDLYRAQPTVTSSLVFVCLFFVVAFLAGFFNEKFTEDKSMAGGQAGGRRPQLG